MGLTNFPNGVTSFGVPIFNHPVINPFGNHYFVDTNTGSDDNDGKTPDKAFATIQAAVTEVSSNDTIWVAPGTYTENVVTEDDTSARNVSIIGRGGMTTPGWNAGVILAASTSSSPCLQIKASGWRVSGICFKPGATSSGIEFYANQSTANFLAGSAGSLCRGGEVSDCLFWGNSTGKYGIVLQGVTGTQAPHHIHIHHNRFIYLAATSGFGIYVAASGNPVYGCNISFNEFESNKNHIGTASGIGYVGSRFEGNSLPIGGTYWTLQSAILMDLRATATPAVTGGNVVVGNFFGCTASQFADDDSTDWVHANGYDHGMGNWCSDGIQAANISNSSL